MKSLTREAWMQSLQQGRLHLNLWMTGFGTYNNSYGFQHRQIDYHVGYLLLKGAIHAQLHDSNTTVVLRPGAFFLMSPHVLHSFALLHPAEPITLYYFRLSSTLGDDGACRLDEDMIHVVSGQSLRQHIEQLFDIAKSRTLFQAEQLHGMFLVLFARIFQPTDVGGERQTLSQGIQSTLNRFIREQMQLHPTPTDLANAVGLSPDYFARLFKRTYGISPRTWLVQERIRVASTELLETRKTVTQVAEDLGYTDIYLFSRQFKAIVGYSPSTFRKRYNE